MKRSGGLHIDKYSRLLAKGHNQISRLLAKGHNQKGYVQETNFAHVSVGLLPCVAIVPKFIDQQLKPIQVHFGVVGKGYRLQKPC